jgi:hypothetical protein
LFRILDKWRNRKILVFRKNRHGKTQ